MGKGESLGQVFQNLISNAISFNPKDGVVNIYVQNSDENVLIKIEDQGPGIPESQLGKIFQRFYTDRPAGHEKSQNSGLGLSIAKQIIEAHNGNIHAENIITGDKIVGARFVVRLKLYED